MSILKQVKEVLRTKEVLSLDITFENGSTKTIDLEGKEMSKKAVKRLLDSIEWDSVAEVNFEVVREEADGDEDEDDEDDEDDDDDND